MMSTIELSPAPRPLLERPFTAPGTRARQRNATALRVRDAGTSFHAAMFLLPAFRRQAMYALYAFYREVDDIADGEASCALKLTLLGEWRGEIARLFAGRPQHVVTLALCEPVQRYSLRCDDFLAIIDGMEMHAQKDIRAPSFAELDLYCSRVAVAAGLLSIRIFGDATPMGARVAEELGRGLQLTNILRNLASDAARGRLYLPRPILHSHGIFATIPSAVLAHPALFNVCRDVVARAEEHYAAAAGAIALCPRPAMRPAAMILAVHRAELRALLARGWDRLCEPVRIRAWRQAAILLRHGLTGRVMS
jgi:phytoene synthase